MVDSSAFLLSRAPPGPASGPCVPVTHLALAVRSIQRSVRGVSTTNAPAAIPDTSGGCGWRGPGDDEVGGRHRRVQGRPF